MYIIFFIGIFFIIVGIVAILYANHIYKRTSNWIISQWREELKEQIFNEEEKLRLAREGAERTIEANTAYIESESKRRAEATARLQSQNLDLMLEGLKNTFEFEAENYRLQLEKILNELDEYRAKREAVNQAILREREIEEKENFYRINIKQSDIDDISILHSIESRLTNREILNKLIYKSFIEKPLLEMEKRVLGGHKMGGIYKITYIKTGESYIGRSVDIANRWKEHCMSSLNIGSIAHSTFHNTLADKGLQNFTWEVLEEVEKEKQNEREKYWIDFYGTQNQYNEKAGG